MSRSRLRVCLICLLLVGILLVSLQNVQASPFVSRKEIDLLKIEGDELPATKEDPLGGSYQDDKEFKREIKEKLEELAKNKGVLFDRILLVNSLHKRWNKNYEEAKRSLKQNAEGSIIQNNLVLDDIYFEGDIILDEDDKELINGTAKDVEVRRKRNALYQRKKIWTTRVIPYVITASLSSNSKVVNAISTAINIVHTKTCIRWVKYNPSLHKNYVSFMKGVGCYSKIGKKYYKQGSQDLSIGEGCEWIDTVLHEMTHAMGFFHEQSRDDRDKYIKVIWENIPVALQDQFEIYSHGTIDKMGIEYDYNSIMHYSSTAFGSGKVTIEAIDPTKTLGSPGSYTNLDVIELNTLYRCQTKSSRRSAVFSSWSGWSECDQSCYKERQSFCFLRNKAECLGSSIYGIKTDRTKCTANECPAPVDGNWGKWAAWGGCSRSCDEGKRRRSRTCNKPAPSNNGKFCIGKRRDISVCLNRRCNIGPYDVDFENGWGMWTNADNAVIPWALLTGPVKTLNTGPLGDHTLQGKGNYIYVESSRPRVTGNYARLVSNVIEFSNPQCFSFYYTMHGAMMGFLTLWIVPFDGGNWGELFLRRGEQGTKWLNADVTLDHQGKFQLAFQATLGGTGTSDIALDDIFIDNGACPGYVKPNTTPRPVCEDIEGSCPTWASNGECKNNPNYMNDKCKASCGLCPVTTTPTPEIVVCEDIEESCPTWASNGECKKSTNYMNVKCKASCGLCPVTTTPTPEIVVCEDIEESCPTWASNGECKKNTNYMNVKCKASCGLCPVTTTPTPEIVVCEDIEESCPNWASNGECKRNTNYMNVKCKASCGLCPVTTTPTPEIVVCEDIEESCPAWARSGECNNNPDYMNVKCKASCGLCPKPCTDTNPECPRWEREGECVKTSVWMGQNCKKSCGKC